MSEWVHSEVTVEGPVEELKKLYTKLCPNKDGGFSLESIIPVPKGLDDTLLDTHTEKSVLCVWALEHSGQCPPEALLSVITKDGSFQEAVEKAEAMRRQYVAFNEFGDTDFLASGRQGLHNILTYGAIDLRAWRLKNYGVKYDVQSGSIGICNDRPDGPCVQISFMPDNSFPDQAFRALARMFPELTFTCSYADDNMGPNCGILTLKGDFSDFQDKSKDLAFFCWVMGEDMEEYLDENKT